MTEVLHDYIIPIGFIYLVALVVHLMGRRITGRIMRLSGLAPELIRPHEKRQRTLLDLLSSTISITAFVLATLFALGRFVDTTTLIWIIGLFGAGFGFGARPLISDFLTGVSFIFEDLFDVGEKVELLQVEGVIEKINLRTVFLRAPTGELYVIPNGEIRVVRNFSRGHFSMANITLKVETPDLARAVALLRELGEQAAIDIPEVIEPWMVINESGTVGQQVELKLVVKTDFGTAADLRPRLLDVVREKMADEQIELLD